MKLLVRILALFFLSDLFAGGGLDHLGCSTVPQVEEFRCAM